MSNKTPIVSSTKGGIGTRAHPVNTVCAANKQFQVTLTFFLKVNTVYQHDYNVTEVKVKVVDLYSASS